MSSLEEGASEGPIRVLIVEDDDFTRVTLKAAIERYGLEVVATASDAKSAITRAVEVQAQVGVFDLDLGPGPTGLDVAYGIRRVIPDFGVVLLTTYEDPRLMSSSLANLPEGAAYIVKQSLEDLRFLIEAITGALGGQASVTDVPRVDLTDAQIETLRLLACGLSNAEIARVRVVETKSVEQAISRTAKRLGLDLGEGLNQRVALARAYYRLAGANMPSNSLQIED